MKISLGWLSDWVKVPSSVEKLCQHLADLGFPVDKVTRTGVSVDNVIVSKILSVNKHPNADRLQVAEVFDGKKKRQIVCGATNIAPDQVVPLALPGAKFANGLEIKVSEIRGVKSEGMLCSEKELELSDEHSGIYQLPEKAQLGISIKEALGRDTILEVDVTPNRPDALSHYGIAQEVGALTGQKIKKNPFKWKGSSTGPQSPISIKSAQACPRYMGRIIQNVKIGPSPKWLVQRLNNCGIRSINNVVDITNYVLLEFGHPLHAFDLALLNGPEIIVRKAKSGEKIEALDEQTYELKTDDLVICDKKGPVAIAGIMGGQYSGVTEKTKDILLESAVFERGGIRKTSQSHQLKSESSVRFEKGTDPETAESASLRAAQLILELTGGQPGRYYDAYPKKIKQKNITLRSSKLSETLGMDVKSTQVKAILTSLGFGVVAKGKNWNVRVPFHRKDVFEEIDLIEEVVRMMGYNQVPVASPKLSSKRLSDSLLAKDNSSLTTIFKSMGFNETLSDSFTSEAFSEELGYHKSSFVAVANPTSLEESILRPSLFPNLLRAVKRNVNYQQDSVRLFEVGHTFTRVPNQIWPEEKSVLSFIQYGDTQADHWASKNKEVGFFVGKGIIETIGEKFEAKFQLDDRHLPVYLHPKQSFNIGYRGRRIGWMGVIHPNVAAELDLKPNLIAGELEISDLVPAQSQFGPFSDIPFVERDIAIIVDNGTSWSTLEKIIRKSAGSFLTGIQPFDIFTGGSVGKGKKSIAFKVRLHNKEKTFSDQEINSTIEKIKTGLTNESGAQLR